MAYQRRITPGTNLPGSITYDEDRAGTTPPIWDKNLPSNSQGQPAIPPKSIPMYTGGQGGGGTIHWYDPDSGKLYDSRGMTTDTSLVNASPEERNSLVEKARNNPSGILNVGDFENLVRSRIKPEGVVPLYDKSPQVNYRKYNDPSQLLSSGAGQQYNGRLAVFGNGKAYYMPPMVNGQWQGGAPIEVPANYVSRTGIVSPEGRAFLASKTSSNPNPPLRIKANPQYAPITPPVSYNFPTSTSNPNPNSPTSNSTTPITNPIPTTPTPTPNSNNSSPPWSGSWAIPNPTTPTSSSSNSLFPPPATSGPSYNLTQSPGAFPSVGQYFGNLGKNYGGENLSPSPSPSNNSSQWNSFIRQWLSQYNNGNQGS